MLQGRGYVVAIDALTTGTTDDIKLIGITAATDKPLAIGNIQGHFQNGDSSENVSFQLVRCTSLAGGSSVTPRPTNPDDTAAGFTVVTGTPTATLSPVEPLAVFGGNGAANFGWFPTVEEHQIILKPADQICVVVAIAPTSALTMQATINITEL